jgi:hypothetical protein
VIARKVLDEIALSNYQIVKREGVPGHVFEPPTGPMPDNGPA